MEYQIKCLNLGASSCHYKNSKIISVGLALGPTFLVRDVIEELKNGTKFFTVGKFSNKKAYIQKYFCDFCGDEHIRSVGDVEEDNNLEELPNCK